MKISQIITSTGPTDDGLPPLQAMLLDEINRRSDEVFESNDEGLLRIFPRLKRSSLSWSLYLLHKKELIAKRRVRINGRLITIFGSHEAVQALKEHLNVAD